MSRQRRTFALDFDGVLHQYNGWQDGLIQGPIPGAKEAVLALLKMGHNVVVFTTRDHDQVEDWLEKYELPDLLITNVKRPFYCIVDDRAVRFEGVWSEAMINGIATFEPYWIRQRNAAR